VTVRADDPAEADPEGGCPVRWRPACLRGRPPRR